jgi:hypothetical protein
MFAPAKLAAVAMATLAVATSDVLAQRAPTPHEGPSPSAPGSQVTLQAPVGHRQPKISDLPPELARDQRSGDLSKSEPTESSEPTTSGSARGNALANAPARGMIDEWLRICRGC